MTDVITHSSRGVAPPCGGLYRLELAKRKVPAGLAPQGDRGETGSPGNISAITVVGFERSGRIEANPEYGREEILRFSTSLRELIGKRDFYAGGLMLLLGLGIALKGSTYRGGTLMHMGPGFLPTALGILLVLLGIAIAAASLAPDGDEHGGNQSLLPEHPQWWAWFCILMSPVAFIFFGRYFGMLPGTFACVFIAALGDKTATWKGTIILAAVVTAFGVTLFSYFLQVPMPILTFRGEL
jgi:putative Ca2+/H+ antiporter (TMEM165/GDT1 family)